jgi:Lon protease-like protein
LGFPESLPLFPLPDVVLFPGMPLPLHIFEPRYRQMVKDALDGSRLIGMTLLRPGWEADYEGRPAVYPSGCAGRIEQCEALVDGRFNIVLKGLFRFKIKDETEGRPYRTALYEASPEALGDPEALDRAREKVVGAIGQGFGGASVVVIQPELSHDVFANALCQSLDLTPVERQCLLDCDTILDRYTSLSSILEFRALEQAQGRRGAPSA